MEGATPADNETRTREEWIALARGFSQGCEAEQACGEIRRELDAELAKRDWIPVGERLPEGKKPEFDGVILASERVLVLVAHRDFTPTTTFGQCLIYTNPNANGAFAWRADGWHGNEWTVTHWMPLPAAPEAAK